MAVEDGVGHELYPVAEDNDFFAAAEILFKRAMQVTEDEIVYIGTARQFFAREADERGAGLLRRHFRSRHARMARPGVGQRYCPARMDSGVAFLRYPVAEQTAYKLEAG